MQGEEFGGGTQGPPLQQLQWCNGGMRNAGGRLPPPYWGGGGTADGRWPSLRGAQVKGGRSVIAPTGAEREIGLVGGVMTPPYWGGGGTADAQWASLRGAEKGRPLSQLR